MKHANDNDGPLGKVYTLSEAADYLKTNKNALARVARRTGNCSIIGRTVLFSDSDILAIWDELRCHSQNSNEEKSGTSGEVLRSANERSLIIEAQAFLEKRKPKSTGHKLKRAS